MQHLWSVATWEIETSEDDPTSGKRIGAPVTEYSVAIKGKRKDFDGHSEPEEVPLPRELYLLTAWYVHDFLDKMHISFTDPNGRELWYNEPRLRSRGISTKAIHVIPIWRLWYSVDGLYSFTFQFSNDDGRSSETGSFRIVLNRTRRI